MMMRLHEEGVTSWHRWLQYHVELTFLADGEPRSCAVHAGPLSSVVVAVDRCTVQGRTWRLVDIPVCEGQALLIRLVPRHPRQPDPISGCRSNLLDLGANAIAFGLTCQYKQIATILLTRQSGIEVGHRCVDEIDTLVVDQVDTRYARVAEITALIGRI